MSDAVLATETGEKIRRTREALGWSQDHLAGLLGCTQTAVSYWESGKRAIDVTDLVRLAAALEIPARFLLPGEPAPEGHQFHLSVAVQGEGADWADWMGEPFTLTVRAWSLSAACTKAAAVPLAGWTHPAEEEQRG